MRNSNKIRILVIIAVLLMLTAIGYLIYANQNKQLDIAESQERIEQITTELYAIEESFMELEVLFKDKNEQIRERNELLRQKYQELGYLEDQVDQLKRKTGVDQRKIRELEQKLAAARAQLDEYALLEIDFLVTRVEDQQGIIDSISGDAYRLRERNQELERRIIALGGNVPKVPDPGTSQVTLPQAVNFKFNNKTATGKKSAINFKKNELEDLEICMDLLGGISVVVDVYELYLEYRHPNGLTTINGQFQVDNGVKRAYSAKKEVKLEGDRQTVCIDFNLAPGEEFMKGTQLVIVYCKGQEIGRGEFMIE